MPLEKTEAIILKIFNWSESSRTVLFFSKEYGKYALVDKGGRNIKSKRGRLQQFSLMEVTFYSSKKESSGYISDVELIKMFSMEKEGTLGRLAYASAACELLNLLLPEEEPQITLYQYFVRYLNKNDIVEKKYIPAIFIAFFIRTISQLGYHPSFNYCANCNKEINFETQTGFNLSPERGGIICQTCKKAGDYYIQLSNDSLRLLNVLQRASLDEASSLPIGFKQTGVLLEVLEKLLAYQAGLNSRLKSLEFLNKLKNSNTLE